MKYFDRVKETATTTGTGDFTLAGAATGFRTFASVLSINDTCYYCIALQGGSEWEVGLGTYSASNTLTRTTVLSSSNSNNAVNFSSGTKDVFLTVAASYFGLIDLSAASSDYELQPGETAVINYSSASSVLLRVTSKDYAEYDLTIMGDSSASGNDSIVTLSPNNTSYSSAISQLNIYEQDHSNAVTGSCNTTSSTFFVCQGLICSAKLNIITSTLSKSVRIDALGKASNGYIYSFRPVFYWRDTSTAWSSLGTFTFPTNSSGRVYIKRIA